MDLQRGYRNKLESHFNIQRPITVSFQLKGPSVYDISCFGVDQNGKLSDESYMIFFNQLHSPNHSISLNLEPNPCFTVDFSKLPPHIAKLSFTISIDGHGTMDKLEQCVIQLSQQNKESCNLHLKGNDFQSEKAVIGLEFYIKSEWRFQIIAQGFNGGLPELLKLYGGVELTNEPTEIQQTPPSAKVSLEKKLEKSAPALISLAKPIGIVLKKK